MEITTLFNDFFKYQLDVNAIAAACKQCKLDTFIKIGVAICAYLGFDPKYEQGLRYEFVMALAYKICVINGVHSFGI